MENNEFDHVLDGSGISSDGKMTVAQQNKHILDLERLRSHNVPVIIEPEQRTTRDYFLAGLVIGVGLSAIGRMIWKLFLQ